MFNEYVKIVKAVTIIALVSIAALSLPVDITCEEARIILRAGQITSVVGEVDVKKAGKSYWTKASTGLLISQFDIIKTHEGASVDIEFSKKDGKYFKLRLREKSRLKFTKLKADKKTTVEDTLLDLAIGDILIKTDKLHKKSKFKVRTPTSMIGVRGTKFRVIYK